MSWMYPMCVCQLKTTQRLTEMCVHYISTHKGVWHIIAVQSMFFFCLTSGLDFQGRNKDNVSVLCTRAYEVRIFRFTKTEEGCFVSFCFILRSFLQCWHKSILHRNVISQNCKSIIISSVSKTSVCFCWAWSVWFL